MIKYGLPYQGSKKSIADDIIAVLPAATRLYDLFAGGCAITHAALLSGKWQKVIANDLQDAPQLFIDAVNGQYRNEKRWIGREQFYTEKAVDPYIRWVWSFGNGGCSYLFGKEIEPIKKAAHDYLFKNGYDGTKEKRLELIKRFKSDKKIKDRFKLQQLQQLQQLERLQQLEQLERLQQLEQLERRLIISALDYRKVKVASGAVIYCDPPYHHKTGNSQKYYGVDFDSEAFYKWVRENKNPVYFSSIDAPRGFKIVWKKDCHSRMNNKGSCGKKAIVEKLFWNGVKCS